MAFSKILVAAVAALSVATSVAAAPVAKYWDESKFEPYAIYHARYNALECKHKHNTDFFNVCCGPLANGQPLSARPAECNPDSNTSTQDDDGDDDCDGEDDGDNDDGATTTTTLNPTTTTTEPAKTTTTTTKTAVQAAHTNGSVHTGHGTWYTQDGVAGACGKKHSDSDLIGAMNYQVYGNVNRVSSVCGKRVLITNKANKKQVTIVIADACPSCPKKGDIDLSRGAFGKIGDFDTGVLDIEWTYLN